MNTLDKHEESGFEDGKQKNQKRVGTVSRRDVLKAGWTVPVVLAVAPSVELAAGSCPGQGSPNGAGSCNRPPNPPQGSTN